MRSLSGYLYLEHELIDKAILQSLNGDSYLFHGIPIMYCYCMVFLGVKVIDHTEGGAGPVLSSVSLIDIVPVAKLIVKVFGKFNICPLRPLVRLFGKR